MLASWQTSLADSERGAFRLAMIQQVPILLACVLMLDGGLMAKTCAVALVGYWAGVLWLKVRRPSGPSASDIVYVRWGFVSLFLAAILLRRWLASGA